MRLTVTLSLVWLALPAVALAGDDADTWNLTDLFATLEDWEAAKADLSVQADAFSGCSERITKSARDLASCLDAYFGLRMSAERVSVYASSESSVDARDADASARAGDVGMLWSRLGEATAFVEPALVEAGADRLDKWVARTPALADYAFFIDSALRASEHTLDAQGEGLLASASPMMWTPFQTFNMLTTADMTWPTVTLADGSEATVDKPGYNRLRSSTNRDDRAAVFAAFYDAMGGVERTLGTTLNGALSAHHFEASARGFDSTVEAALFGDGIPVAVYTTLVETTNANLPTLHRYLRLRARMLGVEDPGYIDIYPPLVDLDITFPLELGKQLSLDSSAPLGDEYVAVMKRGFDERWMHAYPVDGKEAGAYATGAYDVHPYVLMNYQDDYESVSTLAHEWGHAMHTYLASQAQPYPTADYDTFMAEVASTFNEALLLDHMLEQAQTDEERLYYLGHALEGLRGTFFRQAMFAEFELAIHQRVEAGEAMTGERLSALYLDILRRYHGHDVGVMRIDEAYAVEWAWIPHFYFDYYVFQYATSISASSLLAQRVLGGEEGAIDAYLDLLRAGGSAHSYDLLSAAGVDLATPAPYEATVARMNAIMDEMEALLPEPAPAADGGEPRP